ncbi:hypothetical protein ES703_49251 [subsurface metagenome]
MKMPIPIFIVGSENWEASHIFNPNAFPEHVKNFVFPCMDCLSMFIFLVNQVEPNIKRDKNQFLGKLRTNKAFDGLTPDPNKPCVVVYHNARFLVALHLALYSARSFLDVYSKLIGELIFPHSNLKGFRGRNSVIWALKNRPHSYTNIAKLMSAVRKHSSSWMRELIKWRNDLIHDGQLPKPCVMCIPLIRRLSEVTEDDIILPQMPNGVDVVTYFRETRNNLSQFIRETLVLLPDIDFDLVSLDTINK